MSCLLKICAVIAFMLSIDTVQSSPLFQGFSVQKGFEVKFKPFEFKPLAFFKEAWSPFGRFGIRKGIQKRDLAAATKEILPPRPEVVPPAPVFEFLEEGKLEERKENERAINELQPGPEPISVKPISSNLIRIPLETVKSSTEPLYTKIGLNPQVAITAKPIQEVYGELPPRSIGPVPEQVSVSPQPIPVQPISRMPVPFRPVPNGLPSQPPNFIEPKPVNPVLFQPIVQSPGLVQSAGSQVIPLITPPPQPPSSPVPIAPLSEIPPTDGPLVRGSKMALYFGNVLLQLVSQFLTNARMQITQYRQSSNLPPIPPPFMSGGNK